MPSIEIDLANLPPSEFTTPIPGIFDHTMTEEGITGLVHEYQEEYSDQEQEIPETEEVSTMSADEIKTFIENIGKEQGIEITPRTFYLPTLYPFLTI